MINKIRTMKFYVAFSIHGSNRFRVAVKHIEGDPLHVAFDLAAQGFLLAQSRRFGYDESKDGYKLHWNRLNKSKDGEPYRDDRVVAKRFQELKKMGWTIVEDAHGR